MDNCIFCKIIKGEIPSETVFENEEFKVILDAFPASKGHVLVLPKKHSANIFELDEELAGNAYALASRIAKAMNESGVANSLNVVQNNGEAAGQTVSHFHIHLIPRESGDSISIGWKPGAYSDGEAKEYTESIAGKL